MTKDYDFRPAVASAAKPLIGLYAESGTGKTYGALLLACGFAKASGGSMADVGMIETESGRGEAYADDPVVGGYRVLSLARDFSPKAYGQAIAAAEDAKLKVLIIDSASHEWEGTGGVLDLAAKNKEGGAKGVLVWQQPKIEHKREFVNRMTQTPIPLVIVCMRAKYAMEEVEKNKWVRAKTLTPTQSDDILHEMFVHGWTDHEHRLHVTKYTATPDQLGALRKAIVDGERISIETGRRLAEWAARRKESAPQERSHEPSNSSLGDTSSSPPSPAAAGLISEDQAIALEDKCREHQIPIAMLCAAAKVAALRNIASADYQRALGWIDRRIAASNPQQQA